MRARGKMSRYEKMNKARLKLYDEREKAVQRARDNPKAVKANTLALSISLENKKCITCGSTKSLVRHHEDYDKPLQIDIVCRSCHANIHHKKRMLSGDNPLNNKLSVK